MSSTIFIGQCPICMLIKNSCIKYFFNILSAKIGYIFSVWCFIKSPYKFPQIFTLYQQAIISFGYLIHWNSIIIIQ